MFARKNAISILLVVYTLCGLCFVYAAPGAVVIPVMQEMRAKPERGRNSYTGEQVHQRLLQAGFVNIRQLRLGQDGIWRGLAVRNDRTIAVSIDYRGKIFTE